jgi:hypothetical protein
MQQQLAAMQAQPSGRGQRRAVGTTSWSSCSNWPSSTKLVCCLMGVAAAKAKHLVQRRRRCHGAHAGDARTGSRAGG